VNWNGDVIALARHLGRTPDALRLRARVLGVHDPPRRHRWTEWEDAVVRDGYTSGLPCAEIAHQLSHRSPASVAARARKLGLVSYARRWSTQDDRRLMQLTLIGTTIEDAAQKLNRTPEAIRHRAGRLGITPPARARAPRDRRRWTPAEDELLRLHHALNPARLAQLLGRSDGAVCRRVSAVGPRRRPRAQV
jgi:transposase-like protein